MMTKRFFFVLGLVVGFLFAEILRRKKLERLQTLEAQEARRKARNAEYERDWQQELANMPFEERMDYELFEASLKLDKWLGEGDDAETD